MTTETGNRQAERPGGSNGGVAMTGETKTRILYYGARALSNDKAPVADLIAQARRRIRRSEEAAALAAFTLARHTAEAEKHRRIERALQELAGRKRGAHG